MLIVGCVGYVLELIIYSALMQNRNIFVSSCIKDLLSAFG